MVSSKKTDPDNGGYKMTTGPGMLYIFDWDGTLCDSLDLIAESIKLSCQQLGLPARSEQERRSTIGLGLEEAMLTLYPDLSEQEINQLIESYRPAYTAGNKKKPSKLYDGVLAALDELKAAGHQLAVATGKGRKGLERVLASLDMTDYFDFSRCGDETRSKPHPLMLNEIMEESGIPAELTIMTGDTDFDLLMARAASVMAVGVSYGAHPLHRMQAANPDRIVDHISELL